MLKFVKIFFLIPIFVPNISLASEQGLFYCLHQATNILEQYSRGECRTQSDSVKKLLVRADKELGEIMIQSKSVREKVSSKLEPELQILWRLYKRRDKLNISQVEAFRLKLHVKAKEANLKHNDSWHKEARLCGTEMNL